MNSLHFSHTDFEAENPTEREYAEHAERTRQARHLLTHDSLDEYRPAREFPCPGWMRTVDRIGDIHIVLCDVCGLETTMRERATATTGGEW